MLRIIFALMMLLHGMLHLVGFSREWHFGTHSSTRILHATGVVSRLTGIGWLIATALFAGAGILYLLRKEWYWLPGAAAITISQVLVILQWQDARYATIVNIILLVAIFFSAMVMHFNNQTRHEVQSLIKNSRRTEITVTEDMVAGLPLPVQRWLRRSGVVGKALPAMLRLTQKGVIRTKPEGSWMPFTATQHFSIDPPSFVWSATIQAAPFMTIAGRDTYKEGHGQMLIRPLYLFNAANSSGKQVDQGTLLRYVAEMAWFPQAAVSHYLTWQSISNTEASVTMTYGNVTASGVYRFDDEGRVIGFQAKRYGDFGGIYKQETWSITTKEHRTIGDSYIGTVSEVTWKLQEGDFHWMTVEVNTVDSASAQN